MEKGKKERNAQPSVYKYNQKHVPFCMLLTCHLCAHTKAFARRCTTRRICNCTNGLAPLLSINISDLQYCSHWQHDNKVFVCLCCLSRGGEVEQTGSRHRNQLGWRPSPCQKVRSFRFLLRQRHCACHFGTSEVGWSGCFGLLVQLI